MATRPWVLNEAEVEKINAEARAQIDQAVAVMQAAQFPRPVFNRNQGPIAEAEARRSEVSAQFLAMQAGIIEQSQTTLTRYRGALGALDAARHATL